MKKYELLVCKEGVNYILEQRNVYANDVRSLFEYFKQNYKGFKIAYIENATIGEMSELRGLE